MYTDPELCHCIDFHCPSDFFLVQVENSFTHQNSGIVDEDVDFSEILAHLCCDFGHLVSFGHITLVRHAYFVVVLD